MMNSRIRLLGTAALIAVLSLAMFSSVADAALTPKEWKDLMIKAHTPKAGCFEAAYPSTEVREVACGPPSNIEPTVGGASGDWTGHETGLAIGSASGSFSSVSGLTSETDNPNGDNYYSIQVNSKKWSGGSTCTVDTRTTTCWVQFVWQNQPGPPGPNQGNLNIWYWLVNFYSQYNYCPTNLGYTQSTTDTASCRYVTTSTITDRIDPPSSTFPQIIVRGTAKDISNNDQASLCTNTHCWYNSEAYTRLNLYQYWYDVEWNIFGVGGLSIANFNTGTSISINVNMWDSNGAQITPSVNDPAISFTGERNNMNLGSYSTGLGYYRFSESI